MNQFMTKKKLFKREICDYNCAQITTCKRHNEEVHYQMLIKNIFMFMMETWFEKTDIMEQ